MRVGSKSITFGPEDFKVVKRKQEIFHVNTYEEDEDEKLEELMKLMDKEYGHYMSTLGDKGESDDERFEVEFKKIDGECERLEQLEAEEIFHRESQHITLLSHMKVKEINEISISHCDEDQSNIMSNEIQEDFLVNKIFIFGRSKNKMIYVSMHYMRI